MSDIAIQVENLSKQYKIGAAQEQHDTLRDWLVSRMRRRSHNAQDEMIWALKDVSFEVKKGEVLGIIGRNGAGKSTLLKILSRITEPTRGRAVINGRMGSLLEVGTGFHPELTGRENIYLSGTILGMKKAEIDRRFDEIVDFSGVEKFIDTPIKRYSSGMMVRLGFAVAAHMEPEILIVDEVLAVGDVRFQKKCNEAMKQTASSGRTVILVSHNMAVISSLCRAGILLDQGMVKQIGNIDAVVEAYILDSSSRLIRGTTEIQGDDRRSFRVTTVSTLNENGGVTSHFTRQNAIIIQVQGKVIDPNEDNVVAIDVHSANDQLLFRTHSFEQSRAFAILREEGNFTLECTIPANLLPPGTFRLGLKTVAFGKHEIQSVYPTLEFEVVQNELLGNMLVGTRGMLTPACIWSKVNHAD